MTTGEKIKNLREEKGLSREKFGALINIAGNSVYRIENGLNLPDAKTLLNISKTLDVSIDYLLGVSEIRSIQKESSYEIPYDIKQKLLKLEKIQSQKLPEQLEKIGIELIEISKMLKEN